MSSPVITSTATRGWRSGTGDRPTRGGPRRVARRDGHVGLVGDAKRAAGGPRRADLARKRRRSAPRRAAHRSGRLPGHAVLFACLVGAGSVGRARGGRGSGRRSLAVPRSRPAGRRPGGAARAAGGVLRVAASFGWGGGGGYASGPARRGRLGCGAAAGDGASPPHGGRPDALPAAVLGPDSVGRVLS